MRASQREPTIAEENLIPKTKAVFEEWMEEEGLSQWPYLREVIDTSWRWIEAIAFERNGPSLSASLGVAMYRIFYRLILAGAYPADTGIVRDALASSAVRFVDEGGTPEQIGRIRDASKDISID